MKTWWTLVTVLAVSVAGTGLASAEGAHDLPVATSLTNPALRSLDPAAMTDGELVDAFALTAALWSRARRESCVATNNHYYGYPTYFYSELRKRGPAAQRGLLPLLAHADPFVRCEAARHVIAFAPEAAQSTLVALLKLPKRSVDWAYPPDLVLKTWQDKKPTFIEYRWDVVDPYQQEKVAAREAAKREPLAPWKDLDRAGVDRLIAQHGLSHLTKTLSKNLRPGIWLRSRASEDSEIPIGASKFGGLPDLPAGAAWPTFKERRMAFLGQVQLSALAPHDVAQLLPTEGTLSFFYDADSAPGLYSEADLKSGAVLYSPVGALGRTPRPTDLLPELVYPASRLHPATHWKFRHGELEGMFNRRVPTPREEEKFARLNAGLVGVELPTKLAAHYFVDTSMAPAHQMLGWADDIQGEMEPSLASDGKTRAGDWRLLLQVDSDEVGNGWMWGDAGRIFFWITEQDLRARRFDRVVVLAECS